MEERISICPKILGEELLTITTEYAKFDKINKRLEKCTKCVESLNLENEFLISIVGGS